MNESEREHLGALIATLIHHQDGVTHYNELGEKMACEKALANRRRIKQRLIAFVERLEAKAAEPT